MIDNYTSGIGFVPILIIPDELVLLSLLFIFGREEFWKTIFEKIFLAKNLFLKNKTIGFISFIKEIINNLEIFSMIIGKEWK